MSFERRVILVGNLLTLVCGVCVWSVLTLSQEPVVSHIRTFRYIKEPIVNVSEYEPPKDIRITIHGEEILDEHRTYQQFSNPAPLDIPTVTTDWEIKYSGLKLTKARGTLQGPSGKETWYNLDMSGVINIMRKAGYSEEEYPYWVRDDGCKMLGQYIILAGDVINTRKRGDIVETSLGIGMMCDHCVRAQLEDPYLIDIAVNW